MTIESSHQVQDTPLVGAPIDISLVSEVNDEDNAFLSLPRDELKSAWLKAFGKSAPVRVGSVTMARILYSERRWQQSEFSKPALIKKLRAQVVSAKTSKAIASSGTRLVREWNGKEHVVDVLDNGYRWNGAEWRSLSAIAKQITGTKWSGPRFFGVAA